MARRLALALILTVLPWSAHAATLESGRTIVLSEASSTNAYLAGTDVTVVAPLAGDLLAAGATIHANAPIAGDLMLAGGTILVEKPVAGDVRVFGGEVTLSAPIGGDLLAAGNTVIASTSARDTRIAGATVKLLAGASGPVHVVGSDITLTGDFSGDVTIEASNSITITDGTHIHGGLKYNAPEQIVIPATALVDGGITYIGSSAYLPTNSEAHTFALAGATILFLVGMIALSILAGLFAGLFPEFTHQIAEKTLSARPQRFVLLTLLGFGVLVATPVLILILGLSFVGIGVAIALTGVYALFIMSAYVYAGILAGAALSRRFLKRNVITWREAVIGTFILYFIGLIPFLGGLIKFILMMSAGGAIVSIVYHFTFKREEQLVAEV
ncbi:MAG: hypothetical protein AAB472_01085 [Patescibacteria group bacterium]